MDYTKNRFLEYNLFCDELDTLPISRKIVINTINQYSFCIAEQDPAFKKALMESDILLPDGIGIVLAVKAASHQIIKKISGADLHDYLLKTLDKVGGTCFYLGSSTKTLKKIDEHLAEDYQNVNSAYFSPPFKTVFNEAENAEMIAEINKYSPDVLFVGMTAPKQEKWVNENKDKINAKVICSIGAVFDFYAGTVKRPDAVWINWGLEWFVRLCKEPKRMWKRYLYFGPIFMFAVVKEMMKNDLRVVTKGAIQ